MALEHRVTNKCYLDGPWEDMELEKESKLPTQLKLLMQLIQENFTMLKPISLNTSILLSQEEFKASMKNYFIQNKIGQTSKNIMKI